MFTWDVYEYGIDAVRYCFVLLCIVMNVRYNQERCNLLLKNVLYNNRESTRNLMYDVTYRIYYTCVVGLHVSAHFYFCIITYQPIRNAV